MSAALAVWVNGVCAAQISADTVSGFCLEYTPEWLLYEQCYPFSPHLPLGSRSCGVEVRNFFANLLPEGAALDVAASLHNLNRHDAFGLLSRLGREVAGALMIVPAKESVNASEIALAEYRFRPLPMQELSERIRQRAYTPFSVWDGRVRLSIAGFQDKLAVCFDQQGNMFLPDGAASSTHIVKPENANAQFSCMPANEYFCMNLARALKLDVPPVALLHIPDALYQVQRFDRKMRLPQAQESESAPVVRLHQIDLCQVLNLSVEMKYQQAWEFSPEGASYGDLFHAAKSTVEPLRAKMALLRWAVFNYLIGNTDAHAKNVSFFLDRSGLRLAPFYDLVSGTVYGLKNLALFIGKEEEIGLVGANDWVAFCQQNSLPPVLLIAELKAQAKAWRQVWPKLVQDGCYHAQEQAFLKDLVADIEIRAQLMREQARLLAVSLG